MSRFDPNQSRRSGFGPRYDSRLSASDRCEPFSCHVHGKTRQLARLLDIIACRLFRIVALPVEDFIRIMAGNKLRPGAHVLLDTALHELCHLFAYGGYAVGPALEGLLRQTEEHSRVPTIGHGRRASCRGFLCGHCCDSSSARFMLVNGRGSLHAFT